MNSGHEETRQTAVALDQGGLEMPKWMSNKEPAPGAFRGRKHGAWINFARATVFMIKQGELKIQE